MSSQPAENPPLAMDHGTIFSLLADLTTDRAVDFYSLECIWQAILFDESLSF